jgi:hypothetical protein
MAKQFSFFLIFTLLVHFSSYAQDNNFFFDITGGSGRLVPHHTELKPFAGPVAFFNAKLGLKTMGQKEWQRVYNYPEIGVGLSHNYLTSKSLGDPTAFYAFINLPLSSGSKLKLDLGMNFGLAWGINPYSEQNIQNIAIGSKCAAYVSMNLNTSFQIFDNLDLLLSAGGYHYSNGNTSKPNKGLNLLGAETGLRYSFARTAKKINTRPVKPLKKSSSIMAFGSWGTKKEATYSPRYSAGTLSVGYYQTFSHKSRFSAGFDLFYDESVLYFTQKETTLKNTLAAGIFGGHELTFANLSIVTQIGVYLRNPNPNDPFYYERLGLRYIIAKRIIPSMTIRAHELKVDFVELGMGFVLW